MNGTKEAITFVLAFIIIFPSSLAVYLVLHELGHAIGAMLVGFRISSFTAGPICLYLKENSYKLKIRTNTFKNYLGRVQPSISSIRDDKQYRSLKGKLAVVHIAGPVMGLITLSIFYLLQSRVQNSGIQTALLVTMGCLFSIDFILGVDIPKFIRVLTDEIDRQANIYFWCFYSNLSKEGTRNFVVKEVMKTAASKKPCEWSLKKGSHIAFYNILLELYLAGFIKEMPSGVVEALERLLEGLDILTVKNGRRNGIYLSLAYKSLTFKSISGSDKRDKSVARSLYFKMESYITYIDNKVLYEKKRAEHFLGIKDNSDFFVCGNNLSSSFISEEGYYKINSLINNRGAASVYGKVKTKSEEVY